MILSDPPNLVNPPEVGDRFAEDWPDPSLRAVERPSSKPTERETSEFEQIGLTVAKVMIRLGRREGRRRRHGIK